MSLSNLLDQYFDVAFAAPDGIKKLRELILSLAMQGKLVSQDPNDQPARELLQEIEKEKERLVKEGKIKQSKPLPEIKPDEVPYDLPKGWEWVRFGEITINRDGERIPVAKEDRQKIQGEYDYYGASGVIDKVNNFLFDKDLLLIGEDGANLINRSTPIAFIARGKYWVNNHAHILDATYFDLLLYLEKHINAIDLKPYVTGTAQPKMNQAKMHSIVIGLPPIAEQRRIVAKIDELMGRCDELEKLRSDRTQKQITVHTAALDRLLKATEQNDFNTAWQFLTQHFSELYSTKANLTELRKAILQLSVMGKLVPQDPLDRPASELLKDIEKEKEKLIKEGKIKKYKPLPEINPNEIPYDLPTGWEWVRLQEVLDVRDGTHDSPKDAIEGERYPLITSKNFTNGKIDFSNARQISAKDYFEISKRSKVDRLDILFSMIGGNIGNQVLVQDECEFSIKNVALFKYYNRELTYPYFFKRYMEQIANYLQQKATGGAQPFVSLGYLRNLVVALPPLAEQHRIVAKINQLMTLCDNLEKQIDIASSKQTSLLNALMMKI